MLVLSRKVGEKIILPDFDVTVTILKIVGKRIRLGISAPEGVTIHREEIWRRIGERILCEINSHPPTASASQQRGAKPSHDSVDLWVAERGA